MPDCRIHTLVCQCQPDVFVQKRQLPQSCIQLLKIVNGCFGKHSRICFEPHQRTGFLGGPDFLQWCHGMSAILKTNEIFLPILEDGDFHPLRKGIDHRGTHTMQTTGYLIGSTAEFTSGMQNSHDSLHSTQTGFS